MINYTEKATTREAAEQSYYAEEAKNFHLELPANNGGGGALTAATLRQYVYGKTTKERDWIERIKAARTLALQSSEPLK